MENKGRAYDVTGLFWKLALGAFLTAATVLTIQVSHVLRGVQASVEGAAAEFHIVAVNTIRQEDSLVRSAEQVARDIDKRTGQLVMLTATQLVAANETVKGVDELLNSVASIALYGDSKKNLSGLLDLTTSLRDASMQIGMVADETARIEKRINDQFLSCHNEQHGNPGCLQSRWLALSGETMKTADSIRRMAGRFEEYTPLFLNRTDLFLTELGGGMKDIHTLTSRYTNPPLGVKLYTGALDAIKACLYLFCK